MAISHDSKLILTASADKNIKIWGLDFGDCHRSLFAHDQAVTCVEFVHDTHHFWSCGRDGVVKSWDGDKVWQLKGDMFPSNVKLVDIASKLQPLKI